MTHTITSNILVSFYWINSTRTINDKVAFSSKEQAVNAAVNHLDRFEIPEHGYKAYLIDRVRGWDGRETHMTTLGTGMVVLMSMVFYGGHGAEA
jgi:hypothetical protein